MGVSSSSANHHPSPGRKLSGLGKTGSIVPPFFEAPIFSLWSAEPRVILGNNSDYIVSYWVAQEDKKRTKAQQERIVSSIDLHLNPNKIIGKNLSEDLKRLKEKEEEGEALANAAGKEGDDEEVYYLTRDHRMGRRGSTQPTHVPFPAGCQHVRLYGFYERDGQWKPYEDKLYSIAWRNKNFRVITSTATINTHVGDGNHGSKGKQTRATKGRCEAIY